MSRSILLIFAAASILAAQTTLPVKWEELTATDFPKAMEKARGVCVLPFGIIEKHGPHLPLGTDLINARRAAVHGAEQEYALVFPEYYFGQIFEARHQPGTIAYSARLQLDLLQETTDEMARNGCRKIVVVNGHGGNNSFLQYFGQSQLARPRDYVFYVAGWPREAAGRPKPKSAFDAHAGEGETAAIMSTRPELYKPEYVARESGADQKRLDLPAGTYTGIWWYARFPNHYGGDAAPATKELGDFDMKAWAAWVANTIRAVKADEIAPRLQKEFFERAKQPSTAK
jgi:creatinine amidohydrolase